MRTEAKDRGVPFAEDPWNEIVDNLWMGGHFRVDDGLLVPVVVGSAFDVVFSLYERAGHGPAADVEHHFLNIPDGSLTAEQIDDVCRFAERVAGEVRDGRRVLVRCQAGYNRSGLVVAHALVLMGHEPGDVVAFVRERRSRWALSNELFVAYLNAGLDVAGLLSGLG